MKFSPLDISKYEFEKAPFRGYNENDVRAFLRVLAQEWGQMLEQQRRAKEQIDDLKARLEHYQRVEEALQEALHTARDNANKKISDASAEGERLIQQTRAEADELRRQTETQVKELRELGEKQIQDAQTQAQQIIQDAKAQAQTTLQQSKDQHRQLEQDIAYLSTRRAALVAELQVFLKGQLDVLSSPKVNIQVAASALDQEGAIEETADTAETEMVPAPEEAETPAETIIESSTVEQDEQQPVQEALAAPEDRVEQEVKNAVSDEGDAISMDAVTLENSEEATSDDESPLMEEKNKNPSNQLETVSEEVAHILPIDAEETADTSSVDTELPASQGDGLDTMATSSELAEDVMTTPAPESVLPDPEENIDTLINDTVGDSTWRVREVVSEASGQEASVVEAEVSSEEELDEMQKIRKILDELDEG